MRKSDPNEKAGLQQAKFPSLVIRIDGKHKEKALLVLKKLQEEAASAHRIKIEFSLRQGSVEIMVQFLVYLWENIEKLVRVGSLVHTLLSNLKPVTSSQVVSKSPELAVVQALHDARQLFSFKNVSNLTWSQISRYTFAIVFMDDTGMHHFYNIFQNCRISFSHHI